MTVPDFMTIHQIVVETFPTKPKTGFKLCGKEGSEFP